VSGMDDLLKLAEIFATEKHKGQVDKAGVAYIEHPRAVVAGLDGEKEKIVGWLHDVVEDTDTTIDDIRSKFGDEIAEAVDRLTHRKGVPYAEYIAGIRKNELARKVKMSDLLHNMDLSRLSVVTEKDLQRVEKYRMAYVMLK